MGWGRECRSWVTGQARGNARSSRFCCCTPRPGVEGELLAAAGQQAGRQRPLNARLQRGHPQPRPAHRHPPVSMGSSTEPSPRSAAITASSSSFSLCGLHARGSPAGASRWVEWWMADGPCSPPALLIQHPPPTQHPPPPHARTHRSGAMDSALNESVMRRAGRWKAASSTVPDRCRSLLPAGQEGGRQGGGCAGGREDERQGRAAYLSAIRAADDAAADSACCMLMAQSPQAALATRRTKASRT